MNAVNLLLNKISESNIDDSLDLAYYLGEMLFLNEIPYYNISSVEEELVNKVFSNKKYESGVELTAKGFLFVVSQPYIVGGHTRLMENLSLMVDEKKNLLITRDVDCKTKKRLDGYFTELIECYRGKRQKSVDFISHLVAEIIKYDNVVLNTHPEDIFAVVACGIAKKINCNMRVYFVNHADHAFSYGASVADFWFEISLYGQLKDNLRGLKGKRSFLGIPINKPESDFFKKITYPAIDDVTKLFTAASSIKYKPYGKKSIFPLVSSILKLKNSLCIDVLGVRISRDYWWWGTKLRFIKQLKLKKSLPYDEYIKVTINADLYIDSHPIPGGTAFVEQFIQGVPCIGLKSDYFGYTPLEKIKKETITEVVEMLKSPPSEQEIKEIQHLVFQVHGFSQVKKRFKGVIDEGVVFENPMSSYIENKKTKQNRNKKISVSSNFFKYLYAYDKILFIKVLLKSSPRSILKLFLSGFYHL